MRAVSFETNLVQTDAESKLALFGLGRLAGGLRRCGRLLCGRSLRRRFAFQAFAEATQTFSQPFAQFRQLAAAEENNQDNCNDKKMSRLKKVTHESLQASL